MTAELPKGFAVRPVTMEDLEAAVALFNTCSNELIGKEQHDVDETRVEWNTPKSNLESDTRVVLTPGGGIVGYVEVWDIVQVDTALLADGHRDGRAAARAEVA